MKITSCRDCEHFHEEKRTPCKHYEFCKAGRPLGGKPLRFQPFKAAVNTGKATGG